MDKYKSLLEELVSFKSISTDKAYVSEINKTVDWLLKQFEKNGFSARSFEGYGNPVVYAKYEVSPNAKTVLIYGHYDVQPAS
ncbi:MAG TPA: peptidase M20, partial [candidate division WWE3 bacterium]|nr:peptidase M20 [candidate division WWE3 bacterium]